MTRLVFVASPFTGAGGWTALAEVLGDVLVVDYGGVRGPDWYEGVARRVSDQADGRPWIAVLHSGAGGFAPSLAQASSDLVGFIFTDAILPHPGRSVLENAPPEFAQRLRERTSGGLLACWNQWFDEDPTLRMLPDPEVRAAFIRDLPRTPFAFLEAAAPDVSGWQDLPCGYLQLSRNYEGARARAQGRGWPAHAARLNHLAMLTEPVKVAEMIASLAQELGLRPSLRPS